MAFNDEEEPLGLVLDTDTATQVREDGRWMTLPEDSNALDGVEIVEVEDEFLDFYDKLNARGTEPTYKQTFAYEKSEETE